MVRRTDRPLRNVRVSFETTRFSAQHLLDAYDRLMPQEFVIHQHAHSVFPHIFRTGVALSITIETSQRIRAASLQDAT